MEQDFTPQLLIKHLYNETNEAESLSVFQALENDPIVQQEFTQLKEAKQALDESGDNGPGKATIRNILEYSLQQHLETV